MKYLFNYWDKISSLIQDFPGVFLFFDYDGTLTPIVSRPILARLSPTIKDSITRLQKNPRFQIVIISGRSLKDIKKMVGVKGIIYAGNHGMEIRGRGIRFLKTVSVDSARPIMRKISGILRREFEDLDGAYVEDKGVTLSMHYRLVKPRYKTLLKSRFKRIVMPFVRRKKVRITSGKEVLEVRPNLEWNKGDAVKLLLKKEKGALAVYIGDDVTDQDAFRAVKDKGISIFVGRPKTYIRADYFLKGPRDVERFIEKLLQL